MSSPRECRTTKQRLDGLMNSIKDLLMDYESNKALFFAEWFLDKTKLNKANDEERYLKNLINSLDYTDITRKDLIERRMKVSQKIIKPIKVGKIYHIKFGYGVGHELQDHHYGIVLARKGLMYLVAPLTSKYQDYQEHNCSFKDLGLPSKKNISHVSFIHIRYIHQRRLEEIKGFNGKILNCEVKTTDVDKIINNYFEIIKKS